MHDKELFKWLAQTKKGQMFREEDGDAFQKVIDANKKGNILYFMLEPQVPGLRSLAVKLGGKRKLIFWRRRVVHNDPENEIKIEFTIHIVGWEENVKGVSIKHKLFIYPNGTMEMNNDETTLLMQYVEATKADLLKNLKQS